jgi:hypothetical protein
VARCSRARVSLPGGCAIGARPIDLHIKGLERLGANITQDHGYVEASTRRLKGAEIVFDKITVTGTEDLLMAAALARLPSDQREALILVGASGFSYEDAAAICGCAVGTIKSRVNRARTRLADLLAIDSVDDFGPDRATRAVLAGGGRN